jgi:hypothetical protein
MSRILRRPMFRGGPASSDGVGITSGLNNPRQGYEDGSTDVGVQQPLDYGLNDYYENLYKPQVERPITQRERLEQIITEREKQTSGISPRERIGLPLTKTQEMEKKGYNLTGIPVTEQQKIIKQYDQDEANKKAKELRDKALNNKPYTGSTENITQNYKLPTIGEDIDTYSKLLMNNAGPDKDEYTRQKYLTLAKFGFNLLKPTPAGIKPSLLSSIATAAEKPLEEYGNISMQQSKEGRATKQLATQLAFQKHMPGNMAKGVQDLMSVNPKMTVEEAISLVTTGKNKAALQKEQMLEVENKKKEIEDLATKDASLKKLSKIDPSFINTYSQIAVEQGLYGHELKGLASDYTVFQPGSIYYAPDKETGQLLPHKFIKGKLYSIREPEFKQKGI